MLTPTLSMLTPGSTFIITRPGEPIAFHLDVTLIGGIVLAAPVVMHQLWLIVAPGLHASEEKLVVPCVLPTLVGTLPGPRSATTPWTRR